MSANINQFIMWNKKYQNDNFLISDNLEEQTLTCSVNYL